MPFPGPWGSLYLFPLDWALRNSHSFQLSTVLNPTPPSSSPFFLQHLASFRSPFPPLTLTRHGLVLVTPLSTWHEHIFLWLVTMAEAKHYFIPHIYQVFSQLQQPWNHRHEPFLLLEILHHELINSMTDTHHLLQFPVWLAKTTPRRSQIRYVVV